MTNWIQEYFNENFIFLTTIFCSYFIVTVKSAVDFSMKRQMTVNMTILLAISITKKSLEYFEVSGSAGVGVLILSLFFYSIKPLPMAGLICMTNKEDLKVYIPAAVNSLLYMMQFLANIDITIAQSPDSVYSMMESKAIITEWVYWFIFLFKANMKFYEVRNKNGLAAFLFISMLMSATIMDNAGIRDDILIKAYAISFLMYYLVIHVRISQQLNDEKDLKLREQRLSLMLSQIQPHFLYNTLNTITALCRTEPRLAEETTIKFSKFLRENMYSIGGNDMHPFLQELEHINIYLDIEKLRFGDRVNVEYDIKSTDFNVPTLTLQPIVENAVKHGICNRIEGGTVRIATEKRGNDNVITISDNGTGFLFEEVMNDGKEHIGIHNANERLKNTLNTEMEIDSLIGRGTTVTIVIPGEKKKSVKKQGERREIYSIGR